MPSSTASTARRRTSVVRCVPSLIVGTYRPATDLRQAQWDIFFGTGHTIDSRAELTPESVQLVNHLYGGKIVQFIGKKVDEKVFEMLRGIRHIEGVAFVNTELEPSVLRHLAEMPNLKLLHLHGSKYVRGAQIGAEVIDAVPHIPSIKRIELHDAEVKEPEVARLRGRMPEEAELYWYYML